MKVIGIVGMPGCGKGEFSLVAHELNIPIVVMGDVIRSEVKRTGLLPIDLSMGIVARELREKDGMGAIAKACIPMIEAHQNRTVLVDGIRGDAEVREFASYFSDFTLISIECPLEIRFNRLQLRGRSDDHTEISDLIERDDRESLFGLKKAMDMADIKISNLGTIKMFQDLCKRYLSSFVGEDDV